MTPASTRLALARLHTERGADWTIDQTVEVPLSYGDPAAELKALRNGCALWDASAAGRLEMTGEDRHRFLNGLVTADVLDLGPGASHYGLFTTIKGRVLSDVTVIVDESAILLRLPPGQADAVREHMVKYVITDRVELAVSNDVLPIVIAGPLAQERLDAWSGGRSLDAAPGTHLSLSILGEPTRVLREERLGVPAFSLWVDAAAAEETVTAMLEAGDPPTPVGLGAVETVRVESGIPRFGVDFGDDTFPQEAGLDQAVSYEKGCYLGQEVVARIHFRGGVNRTLRGLRLDAEVAPGTAVVADGREAGRVTSVARSDDGETLALAMLAVSVAVGERVELDSGVSVAGVTAGVVTAEVVELSEMSGR